VPHPQGGTCPPLAIFARTAGRQIAANIERGIEGRPLDPYRFAGIGDACTVGRRRAVAHLKGIRLTGVPAWVIWRLMGLSFVPLLDRKMRLVADWLLWPIVGRDLINVRSDESFGLTRQHYEPGQDIVRQGDIGHCLYVIWKGEVDVLRQTASGIERLATLGPGRHFGEVAVFERIRRTATVRARTPVEVLSIGRSESLALSALPSFSGQVRATPVSGSADSATASALTPGTRDNEQP
jgi:NADH dehydrogenase